MGDVTAGGLRAGKGKKAGNPSLVSITESLLLSAYVETLGRQPPWKHRKRESGTAVKHTVDPRVIAMQNVKTHSRDGKGKSSSVVALEGEPL
jgi:hypothetical protein